MSLFRRRSEAETATSGETPHLTVTESELLALGEQLKNALAQRGHGDPEARRIGHRYAVMLATDAKHRATSVKLLEWLVGAWAAEPEKRVLALNDLSRVLDEAGQPARAEPCHREALAAWERLRGQNDENTLRAANNLAVTLIELGRRDEAEGLLRDTVARRTRVLGATHPDTIGSRIALAGTLRGSPQRLTEAERLYRAVLADLGDTGRQAGQARQNLAAVLFDAGRLDQAEKMYRRTLTEFGRLLGAEHPATLTVRHNLAVLLNARGTVAEAEREVVEVLAVRRRVLGRHHPETLDSQVSLSAMRANQGRVAEALPLLEDALQGLRATHGPDHPLVRELQRVRTELRGA